MFITKIKVSNGTDAELVTAKSSDSVKDVLDKSGVVYAKGEIQMNGEFISRSLLSQVTVGEIVDDPETEQLLCVEVKAQNAADEATAVITGGAMVIASTATPEQLKTMKKYRPNALKLFEGEGAAKKEVFSADVDEGLGYIGKHGAIFSTRTDKNGKATITMTIPDDVTDVKEWAQEVLGVSILHLRKLEKQFAPMLDEVKAEKEAVAAAIVVA